MTISTMNNGDLIKALAATIHTMGQAVTNEDALLLMADDLSGFKESDIVHALKSTRKKGGRFQISTVLEFLEAKDGRPSADKAWALMPKDEDSTEVVTQDMAEAWGVAQEMHFTGDTVGAQIAFKREYSRLIAEGRESGKHAVWFPSLGDDKSLRDGALIGAAEDGRLSVEHVKGMINVKSLPLLAKATGDKVLLLELSKEDKSVMTTKEQRKSLILSPIGRACLDALRNAGNAN